MLDEVVWCVSDPPQQARLDNLHAPAPFADVQGARYGASTPHPPMHTSSPCTPHPLAHPIPCHVYLSPRAEPAKTSWQLV